MTFAARALEFYERLKLTARLPAGVALLNPYADAATMALVERFLFKFFDDERPRTLVLGINPGRFGGGSTGIGFTDPVALQDACGIDNDLPKRRELSSEFVYRFVDRWGGPQQFFGAFYLTALCPFGFTRAGNNFNFYDDAALLSAVRPFIVETLRAQIALGARRDVALILGAGKNKRVIDELNEEHGFFERVEALDHPRFIMQYRRKQVDAYVERYRLAFAAACRSIDGQLD
jgi:Domain of unknown function (DUF4918)